MTIYVRSREIWATSWCLSAQWCSPRQLQPGLLKQNKKAAEILTKVSWQGLPGDFHLQHTAKPLNSSQMFPRSSQNIVSWPQSLVSFSQETSSVSPKASLACCVYVSLPPFLPFSEQTPQCPCPTLPATGGCSGTVPGRVGKRRWDASLWILFHHPYLTDAWRLWKGIWRILGRVTHGHSGWEKGSRPFPLPWTSVTLWSEPSQSQVLQFLQSHHLGM